MITSTANAQVKELVKLMKKSRARDEAQVFLVEGPRMAGELTSDPGWCTEIEKSIFLRVIPEETRENIRILRGPRRWKYFQILCLLTCQTRRPLRAYLPL